MAIEIIIIKLGAKGDILRTIPIAFALKKKYPDSRISWITKKKNSEFIKKSPYVDEVLFIPCKISKNFDILYNFDIEEEATSLANSIDAGKKLGFCNESGFASAFNLGAEYYLNTLFDDEIKRTNKKTYQEMMLMAAEMPYNKEFQKIVLTEEEKQYAEEFLEKNKLKGKKLIGVHIGSSPRWPSKFWPINRIKEFILNAEAEGFSVILFSGPDDIEKRNEIVKELQIPSNNPDNTDTEFASLVNLCDFVVCGDTFALHVSLALKKKTVALFFCTSPEEVEGYGVLKKIISKKIYDFFPEKQDEYSEELVNSISVEEVLKAINSFD